MNHSHYNSNFDNSNKEVNQSADYKLRNKIY